MRKSDHTPFNGGVLDKQERSKENSRLEQKAHALLKFLPLNISPPTSLVT